MIIEEEGKQHALAIDASLENSRQQLHALDPSPLLGSNGKRRVERKTGHSYCSSSVVRYIVYDKLRLPAHGEGVARAPHVYP